MKIFCVGRNYIEHAKELDNPVPKSPVIFMKPSTAVLSSGRSFFYPSFSNEIHYECELIVKVGTAGKAIDKDRVKDYIEEVSLGIDFTARDIQRSLKKKGHPWELAKSFDFSAAIGQFRTLNWSTIQDARFWLNKNGEKVQEGSPTEMVFSIEYLVHYISQRFTLQRGDIIFTGTPSGVGEINKNDLFEGYLNGECLLSLDIK